MGYVALTQGPTQAILAREYKARIMFPTSILMPGDWRRSLSGGLFRRVREASRDTTEGSPAVHPQPKTRERTRGAHATSPIRVDH